MRAKFLRHKRGSILVLAAIVMPVLLGFAALALDVGYMYDYKQRMGAAADAAAVAGAYEIKRNSAIDSATLNPYVRDDASRNGFTDGTGGVTVTISRPPVSGLHIGDNNYVEVVVSKPTSTVFARIFGTTAVTVSARAVAGPGEGAGCVFALNTNDTKYPTELVVEKGANISIPNCALVSNGDFTVATSSTTVTAKEIDVVGPAPSPSCTAPTPCSVAPVYGSGVTTDPFLDQNQATLFGTSWTCGWSGTSTPTGGSGSTPINGTGAFVPTKGSNYTMNPGVYCGDGSNVAIKIGLNVATADPGNGSTNPTDYCKPAVDDVVTFLPGIYIINGGGLDWKHTCVEGTGVVFYITGTTTTHDYPSCGGSILSTDAPDRFFFSAPLSTTSGFKKWDGTSTSPTPYEGLLFMQDRTKGTACSSNQVKSDMLPQNMILDGALYFATSHMTFGATALSSGLYTILIAGTLDFKGNATLNSNFSGLSGGSPIKRPGLGE